MCALMLQNYYNFIAAAIVQEFPKRISTIFPERVAGFGRSELFRLGAALLFIIGIMLYSSSFVKMGTHLFLVLQGASG
jgi:hypothetical protein